MTAVRRILPPLLPALLFAALLLAALLPGAAAAFTDLPSPRDPADAVAGQWLERMSLEEKVGQIFMVSFEGATLSPLAQELLGRWRAGGVALFSRVGNVQDPEQVARLAAEARRMASPLDRGPGLFVAVDQEGGAVARLTKGWTVMPPAMLLGASGDPDTARRAARITARELLAVGINVNLAPVLDVNVNPDNRAIGTRSYGSDPEAVARFGLAAMAGAAEEGVLPVAKHFPGHGDTDVDSHADMPLLSHSRERLEAVELLPFRRAVRAGTPAIMTGHLAVPALDPAGLPATLSPTILGLLREMGFDGLIVTDSLGMGALARRMTPPEAALAAFKAGADILLFGADRDFDPRDQVRAVARLLEAARSGEVPAERLDASVRRILRAKARFGIKGDSGANPARARAACATPEHLAAARDLAGAGLTVLRPAPGLLPFAPTDRILVLWPGGYQGLEAFCAGINPNLSLRILPLDPGEEDIAAAVREAREARGVVLLASRPDRRPGQAALGRALPGDRLVAVSLAEPQELALFPDAAGLMVAYGANPCVLEALALALHGQGPAAGRLPVALPRPDEKFQENRGG
ncbi:MAG: glycoside hydrolase family 3 protein [Thermodesulfobacteriota bacterium]